MEMEQKEGETPVHESPSQKQNSFAVPVAIVIAGALIGAAIFYSNRGAVPSGQQGAANNDAQATIGDMRPVSKDDHIIGSLDAPVFVVEYSDLECPFCKRFHATMQQAMDEYGKSGKIAWVYRQFPLEQLHPKAFNEAEASECAAKLGGNDVFWKYINKIFEITPSNNGLDPSLLTVVATDLGLDKGAFEKCLASHEFKDKINNDIKDASSVGAQGTPYTVVVAKSGKKFAINGAYPYSNVKQAIDAALASNK